MDLTFLRPLYEEAGDGAAGYVSVYLDATPQTARAAHEVDLRWGAARERLAADGADAATLDAIGAVVTMREHGTRGRVAFGRGGRVLLAVGLPEPPRTEIARYAPLPHVLPLLAQRPRVIPHVRVGADRAGGQVMAVSSAGRAGTRDVQGEAWPVHKVSAGGWAEARLQRSAEETWADNAQRIAEAAAVAADQVHAEFALLGGDVIERSLLARMLPRPLRDSVIVVDREVAPGSASFAVAARAEIARRDIAERQARLDELRQRMTSEPRGERAGGSPAPGPDGRATEGLARTLYALRNGLASDVLIADDPALDNGPAGTAWTGPGPAEVAADRGELIDQGVSAPVPDRADAALIRAATVTGAALFFLPPERDSPRDEVAALLRAPLAA